MLSRINRFCNSIKMFSTKTYFGEMKIPILNKNTNFNFTSLQNNAQLKDQNIINQIEESKKNKKNEESKQNKKENEIFSDRCYLERFTFPETFIGG